MNYIHQQQIVHRDKDKANRYANAAQAIDDFYHAIYNSNLQIDGHIFVSYARKDSDYVYELVGELQQAGLSLWIDQRLNRVKVGIQL